MTDVVICDCGHMPSDHALYPNGCALCDCVLYGPHTDRVPGVDARSSALFELLALVRALPLIASAQLDEQLAMIIERVQVYDRLGSDIDDDERGALELQVESWWLDDERDGG